MSPSRGFLLLALLPTAAQAPPNAALIGDIPPPVPDCEKYRSCCRGTKDGTLSAAHWYAVKSWSENYDVRSVLTSTTRELERYYTFYHLLQSMLSLDAHDDWVEDCYFGVVTTYLTAITALEFEQGLNETRNLFMLGRHMLLDAENIREPANWSMPVEPLTSPFPFLLGIEENNCFGSKLKIYVYDTGKFSAGGLFCAAGQWGVEVLYHRFFAASACRTENPDEADFFFVPDYRACHFHLSPNDKGEDGTWRGSDGMYSTLIPNHKEKARDYETPDKYFLELLDQLPYFNRSRGADHIFVFSDQGFIVNFTHIFPSWQQHIPWSIFLTTEAWTPGCGVECFNPWKDIVIPGNIELKRGEQMQNKSRASDDRDLLFNFHGRSAANHEYYQNIDVRSKILMVFEKYPDVSVGGFTEDYFDIMGRSHFCLVPEGTSSWTNHLYESFFSGCVPVILSDRYALPYTFLDWSQFSIRWPQENITHDLYVYLRQLVEFYPDAVRQMKTVGARHRCWFDYWSAIKTESVVWEFDTLQTKGCSPYAALIHELEDRRGRKPVRDHVGGPWGPGYGPSPRNWR